MQDSVAIIIPRAALRAAPQDVQDWVASVFGFNADRGPEAALKSAASPELGLACLSDAQAREFLARPMKDSTRQLLRAAVELGPRFRWADLTRKIGIPVDDDAPVLGALTGLTKRTRSITGDRKADLFSWPGWNDLKWVEAVGEMDPKTHAAFRRAFGIDSNSAPARPAKVRG